MPRGEPGGRRPAGQTVDTRRGGEEAAPRWEITLRPPATDRRDRQASQERQERQERRELQELQECRSSALSPVSARPTLADVAALAGVSVATASRVLNGDPRVSGEARTGVEDAAAKLSYVRLRTRGTSASPADRPEPARPTGLIAAIVCEADTRLFTDSFYSRILQGVTRALPAGQAQLAILVVRAPADHAAAQRFLARGRADGALVIGPHHGDRMTAFLHTLAVPTVLAGRPLSPSRHPYVDVGNKAGAAEAVRHLIASGRRAIATITGPRDMAAGVDRLVGYREAVLEAGLPEMSAPGDFTQPSGERAMATLLRTRPDLDAVFAASDLMATGALRLLRRAGRRVPEDVAVVGFDDAPFAALNRPPLTTVRQPVEDLGATMADRLLSRMAHDAGESEPVDTDPVILDTRLVLRASA